MNQNAKKPHTPYPRIPEGGPEKRSAQGTKARRHRFARSKHRRCCLLACIRRAAPPVLPGESPVAPPCQLLPPCWSARDLGGCHVAPVAFLGMGHMTRVNATWCIFNSNDTCNTIWAHVTSVSHRTRGVSDQIGTCHITRDARSTRDIEEATCAHVASCVHV
mgnify:CR=1 FL=1